VCRAYGALYAARFRTQPLRAGLTSGAPTALGDVNEERDREIILGNREFFADFMLTTRRGRFITEFGVNSL